jgi:hypothetical protein
MIERDSMQLRHEMKYMLNQMEYRHLLHKIKLTLAPDPYSGPGGRYHVRSLYFDDCRRSALSEKEAGVARRQKYRLRIYNFNQEIIKLERKIKRDDMISKETVTLTRSDVDRIIAGDIAFLANSDHRLLRAFYLQYQRNLLRPKVIVEYYREAYIHTVGNVRVTFDIGLHTGIRSIDLFNTETFTMGISDYPVILEIKYDNLLPHVVRGLLSGVINQRSAISKFVICNQCAT